MSTTIRVTGLQEALDSLSVFQRAQIPFAASWGLNQLGYELRKNEQEYMRRTFNRLNSFTLNAPLYTKSNKNSLRILFYLRDNAPRGNSPDRYLAPQVEGGEVYVTRFSRALKRLSPTNPNRLEGSGIEGEYVMHWSNPEYPSTPGRITAILAGLRGYSGPLRSGSQVKRAASAQQKYFMLGTANSKRMKIDQQNELDTVARRGADMMPKNRRMSGSGYRGKGIYTYKNKKLELVYRVASQPFAVTNKYHWDEDRIGGLAEDLLPALIMRKLETL